MKGEESEGIKILWQLKSIFGIEAIWSVYALKDQKPRELQSI